MKKYLRCFNNTGLSDLTVGKRYEIVGTSECEGDECYVIIDDVKARDHWPIEPDRKGESYRDRFTLETDEEPRKVDGRKAEITDPGERFSTYKQFAIKHGYPNAAAESDRSDSRKRLREGGIVTLLVSGKHDSLYRGDTLWIVEAENGERHIIGEKGLRIIDELSAQPPIDQAAATISALTAKVQALESRVDTLEMAKQPVKVAEGPTDDAPPSFVKYDAEGTARKLSELSGPKRCQTLQEIRDEIVERAKADIERLNDECLAVSSAG